MRGGIETSKSRCLDTPLTSHSPLEFSHRSIGARVLVWVLVLSRVLARVLVLSRGLAWILVLSRVLAWGRSCVTLRALLSNEIGQSGSRYGAGLLVIDVLDELTEAVETTLVAQTNKGLTLSFGKRLDGGADDSRARLEGRLLRELLLAVRHSLQVTLVAELVAVGSTRTADEGGSNIRVTTELTTCTLERIDHNKLHNSIDD